MSKLFHIYFHISNSDFEGNNAGEWLSYSSDTGEILVYTDSDSVGGFGFLKLTPIWGNAA